MQPLRIAKTFCTLPLYTNTFYHYLTRPVNDNWTVRKFIITTPVHCTFIITTPVRHTVPHQSLCLSLVHGTHHRHNVIKVLLLLPHLYTVLSLLSHRYIVQYLHQRCCRRLVRGPHHRHKHRQGIIIIIITPANCTFISITPV